MNLRIFSFCTLPFFSQQRSTGYDHSHSENKALGKPTEERNGKLNFSVQ